MRKMRRPEYHVGTDNKDLWAGFCVDGYHSHMPLMPKEPRRRSAEKFCTGCACPCHAPDNCNEVGKFLHELDRMGFLD